MRENTKGTQDSWAEGDVRYASYMGDGDFKAYQGVMNAKMYGKDFKIEKWKGSSLKTLKQKIEGDKLSDGKL